MGRGPSCCGGCKALGEPTRGAPPAADRRGASSRRSSRASRPVRGGFSQKNLRMLGRRGVLATRAWEVRTALPIRPDDRGRSPTRSSNYLGGPGGVDDAEHVVDVRRGEARRRDPPESRAGNAPEAVEPRGLVADAAKEARALIKRRRAGRTLPSPAELQAGKLVSRHPWARRAGGLRGALRRARRARVAAEVVHRDRGGRVSRCMPGVGRSAPRSSVLGMIFGGVPRGIRCRGEPAPDRPVAPCADSLRLVQARRDDNHCARANGAAVADGRRRRARCSYAGRRLGRCHLGQRRRGAAFRNGAWPPGSHAHRQRFSFLGPTARHPRRRRFAAELRAPTKLGRVSSLWVDCVRVAREGRRAVADERDDRGRTERRNWQPGARRGRIARHTTAGRPPPRGLSVAKFQRLSGRCPGKDSDSALRGTNSLLDRRRGRPADRFPERAALSFRARSARAPNGAPGRRHRWALSLTRRCPAA